MSDFGEFDFSLLTPEQVSTTTSYRLTYYDQLLASQIARYKLGRHSGNPKWRTTFGSGDRTATSHFEPTPLHWERGFRHG